MPKKEPLYPHIPKSKTRKNFIEEELPFASATLTKAWWLATIGNKIYQVEVSGFSIPGVPVWKIEGMFANSVAKVSVPSA